MTDSLSVTRKRDEGSAGDAQWRPALATPFRPFLGNLAPAAPEGAAGVVFFEGARG